MKYTQTFNQFLNEQEEILNEDSSLALMVILQAAIVQGLLIGQMAANSSGDGFHPIDDLKAWWAKRKKDKAVQSIVDKLKDDPEVLAFLKMSNWAQRGKWYKLIEPKLNDEEKKYLKSISRTPFMNEEVNENFLNESMNRSQRAQGPAKTYADIQNVWGTDGIYKENNLDGTIVYSDIYNFIKFNKENGGDVDHLIQAIEKAVKNADK